jgi:hypothetical protein
VVNFQNTGNMNPPVLGSKNNTTLQTSYQNGWMPLVFLVGEGIYTDIVHNHQLRSSGVNSVVFTPSIGATVTNPSATYFGLPSIGFALTSYTFGQLTPGVLSNYGGNWVHKYTNLIVTP